MKPFLEWLLLTLALLQFVHEALPPGNADLISLQTLAMDLSHHESRYLYPGYGFSANDQWVAHHEANLKAVGQSNVQPNWCFYPPLVPFLLSPLAGLGVQTWRLAWGIIQFALMVLFAELIVRLLVISGATPSPHRVLVYALVFGSMAVARSVNLGQTTLLMAVLLWGGVYARSRTKQLPSALMIGTAIFIKPFLALAEIVNMARRKFVPVVASLSVAAALMIISVIAVGLPAYIEYANLLRTLSNSQTAYAGNQSLFAGLLRLTSDMSVMDYGFRFDPAVAKEGNLLALIILAVAAFAQWKSAAPNALLTIGLWISAALLALPISWEHHLLFLLPVLACLWTLRRTEIGTGILVAATVLTCVSFSAFYSETFTGRIAATLPMLGNLILFGLLVTLHVRPRAVVRVHVGVSE